MPNKFDVINREHLLLAAAQLDTLKKLNWSEYYVFVTESAKSYPFKQLVRVAFEIALNRKVDNNYFLSDHYTRQIIRERFGYTVEKSSSVPAFFNKEFLFKFLDYAGKPYRSGNLGDQEAGQLIRKEIFEKSNFWAEISVIDDFVAEPDNYWQRMGKYEDYSWTKIYRSADKGKKIFFTVGVSSGEQALVYKLDRYHSSSINENKLTPEQDRIFCDKVEPVERHRNPIPFSEVDIYDWTSLAEVTKNFIQRFANLYDEVIELVWGNTHLTQRPPDMLFQHPVPPMKSKARVSGRRQYDGNADYDAMHKQNKEIGEAGEQLVIRTERKRLSDEGRTELADKVRKVLDWEGYDILSYQKDGTELYIEVKTTVGHADRRFFMSSNEKKHMEDNKDQYWLYRIYNFSVSDRNGDYFILKGDFSRQVTFEPSCYEVSFVTDTD